MLNPGLRTDDPSIRDDYHVPNINDNGVGSLRQALADANDGDIIDATGVSGVITLSTGELLVDKSVTMNGAGAELLAVTAMPRVASSTYLRSNCHDL